MTDPSPNSPAPPAAGRLPAAVWIALLAAGAVHLAHLLGNGFVVTHNDYWAILQLAEKLHVSDPSTWHNGFYPVGYVLLLKLLSAPGPVVLPTLASVAFGLTALAGLAAALRDLRPRFWLPALAALLLFSYPIFFNYTTQPGPDIGCAAWLALALWRLQAAARHTDPRAAGRAALAGGLFLGLAFLWRAHVLTLAAGLCAGFALVAAHRRPVLTRAVAGFAALFLLQAAVNLAAGRGILGLHTGFLAHQSMYGMDWPRVGTPGEFAGSMLDVFRMSRAHFLSTWAANFYGYLPLLGMCAAPAFLNSTSPHARSALAVLFGLTPYFLATSIGCSDRDLVPAAPLVAFCLAGLLAPPPEAADRTGHDFVAWRAAFTTLLVAGWCAGAWRQNLQVLQLHASTRETYAEIEQAIAPTLGSAGAEAIFSNDCQIYFLSLHPPRPLRYGGWERFGSGSYRDPLPDLDLDWPDYLRHLRETGVRVIVLNRRFGFESPHLEKLYREGSDPANGIPAARDIASFRIFFLPSPAF